MSLKFFSSIRVQLLLLSIIAMCPALVIIIRSAMHERSHDIQQAQGCSQRLADGIVSQQENLVAASLQLASALAQLPEVKNHDSVKLQPVLRDILKINPQYVNISVSDREGTVWASAVPMTNAVSVADRRYFRNALTTGQFSSGEYIDGRIFNKPAINFGYPIKDRHGQPLGVIAVNFNLDFFRNLLKLSKLPEGASYLIMDHKGLILSRGLEPAAYIGKPGNPENFRRMQGGQSGTFTGTGIDGRRRFISYRKLYLKGESTPCMYVGVSIPVKAAMAAANTTLLINLALLTPFMLSAFFLSWYIGKRSIVEPVMILKEASQRMARGELHARVSDLLNEGELRELGDALEDMARKLLEKRHRLEELNTSLESRITQSIADIRRKDQMLFQQSRFAAMGEMIHNIAHQWRQPLNKVGLIAQNLLYKYELGTLTREEMRADIGKIMDTLMFMSGTIDNLGHIFRYENMEQEFAVNGIVDRAIDFMSESLSYSNITVCFEAECEATAVGFPNEYTQVLLNILGNARDTLKKRLVKDPQITIRLFEETGTAVVTVTDNGGGIDEEILSVIFEPYIAKDSGKGGGTGLYLSRVMIEQNMNGRLVAGNVDEGAEFRIEIPSFHPETPDEKLLVYDSESRDFCS